MANSAVVYKSPPWYNGWAAQWGVLLLLFAVGWIIWQRVDVWWLDQLVISDHFVSLVEQFRSGQGFERGSELGYVAVSQTPPLYPLLLGWLMGFLGIKSWPQFLPMVQMAQFGLYVTATVLVFLFAKRRIRASFALMITLMFAISPITMAAMQRLSPDLLYVNFSLIAMIAMDKYFAMDGSSIKHRQVLHCCLWVTLAALTSHLGMALLMAFFTLTFYKLGLKRGMNVVLGVALFLIPWTLWAVSQQMTWVELTAYWQNPLERIHTTINELAQYTLSWDRMSMNGQATLATLTNTLFGGVELDFSWLGFQQQKPWLLLLADLPWVAAGLGLLIFIGLCTSFTQYSGVTSAYVMFFLFLSVWSPVVGNVVSVTLLPYVLFFLFQGVLMVNKGFKELQLQPVGTALLTGLVTISVLHTLHVCINPQIYVPLAPVHTSAGQQIPVKLRDFVQDDGLMLRELDQYYYKAFQWLQNHTPANASLVADSSSMFRLFAQRYAMSLPQTQSTEYSRYQLATLTDYVVEETGRPRVKQFLSPVLEQYPDKFRLVYRDSVSAIRIWKVL